MRPTREKPDIFRYVCADLAACFCGPAKLWAEAIEEPSMATNKTAIPENFIIFINDPYLTFPNVEYLLLLNTTTKNKTVSNFRVMRPSRHAIWCSCWFIQVFSKNPPFWHTCKIPRLMLPQTPVKTQAVVEGFCLYRDCTL